MAEPKKQPKPKPKDQVIKVGPVRESERGGPGKVKRG